jgi:hypothetical protein
MQNKHVSTASLIATHIVQKTNTGMSLEEKEHNPPSAFGKQASKLHYPLAERHLHQLKCFV